MKLIKMWRRFLVNLKLNKFSKQVAQIQQHAMIANPDVKQYNLKMQTVRDRLDQHITDLYQKLNDEQLVELFLIYFSAVGTHMVASIPEWTENLANRFAEKRLDHLAKHLRQHAKEEVGHINWHRSDVRFLVAHYNQKYGTSLDANAIFAEGNQPCVKRYFDTYSLAMRDNMIHQSMGMFYETELMAFTQAPHFVGFCVQELGFKIMKGLSFLQGHMVADIKHVQENTENMQEVLNNSTEKERELKEMVQLGQETIEVYVDYFNQVMNLAEAQRKKTAELNLKRAS